MRLLNVSTFFVSTFILLSCGSDPDPEPQISASTLALDQAFTNYERWKLTVLEADRVREVVVEARDYGDSIVFYNPPDTVLWDLDWMPYVDSSSRIDDVYSFKLYEGTETEIRATIDEGELESTLPGNSLLFKMIEGDRWQVQMPAKRLWPAEGSGPDPANDQILRFSDLKIESDLRMNDTFLLTCDTIYFRSADQLVSFRFKVAFTALP